MKQTQLAQLTNAALLEVLRDVLTSGARIAPDEGSALHEEFRARLTSSAIPKWLIQKDTTIGTLKGSLFTEKPLTLRKP